MPAATGIRRTDGGTAIGGPPPSGGATFEQPAARDIRAFTAVLDGRKVHYHLAGSRRAAFTDHGKTIDIHASRNRESVLAALQLSAQKWGTISVHGNREFMRICVELAAEHGFKIANPEMQQSIVDERARLRVEREHRPIHRPVATSIVEAYRLHLADVARKTTDGGTDPSRFDAEVAVRLRLTGHDRDAITRVIKDAAPALRPGEHRDWDGYARRAVDFAFGLPGAGLAHHLARRREHLLSVEGRSLEGELASRGRGRAPLGR